MTEIFILLLIAAVILIGIYFPGWRRRQILARPFPASWKKIVEQQMPFFTRLEENEQKQLQDNIKLFIAGKRFYGCLGLEITEEIKVTIAAQACLLLLNRHSSVYPRLKHILVYPHAFTNQQERVDRDGIVRNANTGRLGESWHYGKIILSWDDVEKGIRNFQDGHNVVLHEFSHQLDSESGSANGAPLLHTNTYASWAGVLSKEFEELNKDFAHHQKSVMDYYGATNPAEFFAVATGTFFEKPRQLEKKHPELFAVLKTYYAVDPEKWQ